MRHVREVLGRSRAGLLGIDSVDNLLHHVEVFVFAGVKQDGDVENVGIIGSSKAGCQPYTLLRQILLVQDHVKRETHEGWLLATAARPETPSLFTMTFQPQHRPIAPTEVNP